VAGGDQRSESGNRMMPLIGLMAVLAALDLVGAGLARSWAQHGSVLSLAGGIGVFGVLFVVYGRSLRYAELSTVTIGWIVLLQVGVLVLDATAGAHVPPAKVVVLVIMLCLQAYVIAG
jgi:hypothetical protein